MSSRALRERSWGPLLEIVSQDINASRGTPYPCSQRTINATDHFSHLNERPYVSASQAIRELVEHNNLRRSPPPHERDAIRRLSSAVDNAMSGDWGPDLIIKCFIDLDTVFFGGLLRGNVTLDWGDPADWIMLELEVGEGTLGVTIPVPHGRAEIVLNARTVLLDPFKSDPLRTMFATTLHEICVSNINLLVECLYTKFSMFADEE